MLRVGVGEGANHALILCVVLRRFTFEKFHASLAQYRRDLDPLFAKYEIFGSGEEVWHDSGSAQGFIGVFYFRAHGSACPFSPMPMMRIAPDRQTNRTDGMAPTSGPTQIHMSWSSRFVIPLEIRTQLVTDATS